MKQNRKELKQCNHEFVYNHISDDLRRKIYIVITCRKCFYEPPEGYVLDNRTSHIIDSFDDSFEGCDFLKHSDDLKLKSTKITDLKPRLETKRWRRYNEKKPRRRR